MQMKAIHCVDVMGLPGSGKTTFVNSCLNSSLYSFEKCSSLINFYYQKKFPEKMIDIILSGLPITKEYDVSLHRRMFLLRNNFSSHFPREYQKAVEFLYIFLDNGFKPHSFWLQKYLDNWLFVAIAKAKNCQFINDEGVCQRILSVLTQTKLPKRTIVDYFQNIDQIWYLPTSLELSIERAIKRERASGRSAREVEDWVRSYVNPLNYLLSIDELHEKIKSLDVSKMHGCSNKLY